MINWVDGLLRRWAEQCRLGGGDLAGQGYPRGGGAMVLMEPSRAKRRLPLGGGRSMAVMRAGLSSGNTAYAVASRPGKSARTAVMPAYLEQLDRVIGGMSRRDQKLLDVFYVDNYHTEHERCGQLDVSKSCLYSWLDRVHAEIYRKLRGHEYSACMGDPVEREISRLLKATSRHASG